MIFKSRSILSINRWLCSIFHWNFWMRLKILVTFQILINFHESKFFSFEILFVLIHNRNILDGRYKIKITQPWTHCSSAPILKDNFKSKLKCGFHKKYFRKSETLTSWTLFSPVFFQINADWWKIYFLQKNPLQDL